MRRDTEDGRGRRDDEYKVEIETIWVCCDL
jgi:hypothetical protein